MKIRNESSAGPFSYTRVPNSSLARSFWQKFRLEDGTIDIPSRSRRARLTEIHDIFISSSTPGESLASRAR